MSASTELRKGKEKTAKHLQEAYERSATEGEESEAPVSGRGSKTPRDTKVKQ